MKSQFRTKVCILISIIFLSFCAYTFAQIKNPQKFEPEEITIEQLQKGYINQQFTVKEVVTTYLERIAKIDRNGPKLNSIITINPDAIKIAEELDRQLKLGVKPGPMFGVPIFLKDNIDTNDRMPTTAGSRSLKNSFPLKDSYVAKRLREAGAIILGKTNLSEWANFRGELSTSGWSGLGGQT